MIIVGLLLIALAAVLIAGLASDAGGSTEAHFFGLILPNLSARTLVLLGLAGGLLLAVGLRTMGRSVTRLRERRRARRPAVAGEAAEPDDDPFLLGH